jgi:hypothetical protein
MRHDRTRWAAILTAQAAKAECSGERERREKKDRRERRKKTHVHLNLPPVVPTGLARLEEIGGHAANDGWAVSRATTGSDSVAPDELA